MSEIIFLVDTSRDQWLSANMGQFREVGVFLHIVSSYLSNNLGSDGLKVPGQNILYLENKISTLYVLQHS